MSKLDEAFDIITSFRIKHHDQFDITDQALDFANCYISLSLNEASTLRDCFDAKEKLSKFRLMARNFQDRFEDADLTEKSELLTSLFALYSFDNLEFGYDSVLNLIDISDLVTNFQTLAKKQWKPFNLLTSSLASANLANKLFPREV